MTVQTAHRRSLTWGEIMRQPDVWRDWGAALASDLDGHRDWIAGTGAREAWLSGAGSSAYVGDLAAEAMDGIAALRIRSAPSTDLAAWPARLRQASPLVVSFGRSGDSPESVAVMDALDALAPEHPRLNVTCNGEGALARRTGNAGRAIVLPAAALDRGFAMTASWSTMLLTALALLDPDAGDVEARLRALADRAEGLLPELARSAEAAPVPRRIAFIGSGALQHAAREAALKVMELSAGGIAAVWDSSLGFRHGPKSFVAEGTDLALFRSGNSFAALYDDDLAAELARQFPGARLTVSGPGRGIDTGDDSDAWTAPLHVLAAQVRGAVWSARLGLDPDDPFKESGTLTRVVSGVRLHDPSEAR